MCNDGRMVVGGQKVSCFAAGTGGLVDGKGLFGNWEGHGRSVVCPLLSNRQVSRVNLVRKQDYVHCLPTSLLLSGVRKNTISSHEVVGVQSQAVSQVFFLAPSSQQATWHLTTQLHLHLANLPGIPPFQRSTVPRCQQVRRGG